MSVLVVSAERPTSPGSYIPRSIPLRKVKSSAVPMVNFWSLGKTTCPPLLHFLIAAKMLAESSLPLPRALTLQVLVRGGETGHAFFGWYGYAGWCGLLEAATFTLRSSRGVDSTADACSKAYVRSSLTRILADVQGPTVLINKIEVNVCISKTIATTACLIYPHRSITSRPSRGLGPGS